MRAKPLERRGLVLACVLAALAGCRSAPIVEATDDGPMPLIEVHEGDGGTRDPMMVVPNSNVIWLNSTKDRSLSVEVCVEDAGCLEPGSGPRTVDPGRSFATSADRAVTRGVLFPGDAVSLLFPAPGVYTYSITGAKSIVRGEIVVQPRE